MNNVVVTVMMGGISSEREVSLHSGAMVAEALRSAGYHVHTLDPDPVRGWTLPKGTDVVFLALHGTYGEDGQVQTALDKIGIPYTGCGAEASRIGFDKISTHRACEKLGVRMPRYMEITHPMTQVPDGWQVPVVLKPAREGSSVGLQLIDRKEDFSKALDAVLKLGGGALMEERIYGREITVAILDGKPLPVVEICPDGGVYDYTRKYTKGQTKYFCPADLDAETTLQAQDLALKTFHAIGGKDYGRVDLLVDKSGICYVLEINTLPGMCETSLLPKAAAASGLSYTQLCSRLVELALRK